MVSLVVLAYHSILNIFLDLKFSKPEFLDLYKLMSKQLGIYLFFVFSGMLRLRALMIPNVRGKFPTYIPLISKKSLPRQLNMRCFATTCDVTFPPRLLNEFGKGTNTLLYYLKGETEDIKDGSQIFPRQLRKKHFTCVLPEKMPRSYLIAASESCAEMIDLAPSEISTEQFAQALCGNVLLPGLDKPFATVYGCHCYGQWFGQLGDGRALSIGEVYVTKPIQEGRDVIVEKSSEAANKQGGQSEEKELQRIMQYDSYGDHLYELQLKGCGRSPFSRGFDGRAVLRSSVREFLGKLRILRLCINHTPANQKICGFLRCV